VRVCVRKKKNLVRNWGGKKRGKEACGKSVALQKEGTGNRSMGKKWGTLKGGEGDASSNQETGETDKKVYPKKKKNKKKKKKKTKKTQNKKKKKKKKQPPKKTKKQKKKEQQKTQKKKKNKHQKKKKKKKKKNESSDLEKRKGMGIGLLSLKGNQQPRRLGGAYVPTKGGLAVIGSVLGLVPGGKVQGEDI